MGRLKAAPPSLLCFSFGFGDGKTTQYKQFQRIDIVDPEGLDVEKVKRDSKESFPEAAGSYEDTIKSIARLRSIESSKNALQKMSLDRSSSSATILLVFSHLKGCIGYIAG